MECHYSCEIDDSKGPSWGHQMGNATQSRLLAVQGIFPNRMALSNIHTPHEKSAFLPTNKMAKLVNDQIVHHNEIQNDSAQQGIWLMKCHCSMD